MKISSLQNPKIKSAVKLRKRNERDSSKLFIIEGYTELMRANLVNVEIIELFLCPDLFLKKMDKKQIEKINCDNTFFCSKSVFEKISYRDCPDGFFAIAKQKRLDMSFLEKEIDNFKNPFFLVAESIEKPGNLGSILRSCDGAAVDAMIVCDACTDVFNPNVVRASIGTLFTQPVIETSTEKLVSFLKKEKIKIVSATPHTNEVYTDSDLTGPVAIVVGTEHCGLSEKWMNLCDIKIKIPMLGIADSLNVSSSATLLLYEVLRQRNA